MWNDFWDKNDSFLIYCLGAAILANILNFFIQKDPKIFIDSYGAAIIITILPIMASFLGLIFLILIGTVWVFAISWVLDQICSYFNKIWEEEK